VIIPRDNYFHADLPIVKPELKGALLDENTTFIGDVGGDDVGARILGSFAEALAGRAYALYIVLNANRPFTDSPEGCVKVIGEIEAAARLKVTGIVSNTHLMEETDLETVKRGYDLCREVGERTGIPVKFITAPRSLSGAHAGGAFDLDVLPIDRTMLPPWRRREKLGPENFDLKGG
ncbi:MAG: cobalamin biosynthesis protein CbiA, partial [Planctomycetota bacterium]